MTNRWIAIILALSSSALAEEEYKIFASKEELTRMAEQRAQLAKEVRDNTLQELEKVEQRKSKSRNQ